VPNLSEGYKQKDNLLKIYFSFLSVFSSLQNTFPFDVLNVWILIMLLGISGISFAELFSPAWGHQWQLGQLGPFPSSSTVASFTCLHK
jgi:hypothetical protein